jgi:hypothetical protein
MPRVLAAVLTVSTLAAQTAPAPQTRRLRADLDFLCSDVLAGRASLTREADVAARYIAAEFERSGLAPVVNGSYLQPFPLVGYRPEPSGRALTITRNGESRSFRPIVDFAAAFSRDLHLRAPVVFAGYGITAPEYSYDDYAGIDARNRIVLMFDHEPREDDPQSVFNGTGQTLHAGRVVKIANARRHGAAAVLIASEPLRRHAGLVQSAATPNQGQPLRASAPPQSLDDDGQIPAFSIGDDVLAFLLDARKPADVQREIDGTLQPRSMMLTETTAELRLVNAETHRGTSLNVLGLLEGSDPTLKDETMVITAHYDHLGVHNGRVYPGANDNASGTAAVMELARMFTGAAERPKRSILFAVFGSEEQIMLGSFYYVAHPTRPLATTRAVLNLDMIARDEAHIPQSQGVLDIASDTSNRLNIVGAYYSADLLAVIQRNNNTQLVLDTKFDRDHILNALFRCDHLPFLTVGIPAVWLFGGFHPGYHEPSDTVDKLNFPKMEKTIRLTYQAAIDLANAPEPPRFDHGIPRH